MAGGGGGFDVREPIARLRSSICRMADGISGAGEPTASDMPASAKTYLVGFNEGLPCSIDSLAVKDGARGIRHL
jgi:hypothetical protein